MLLDIGTGNDKDDLTVGIAGRRLKKIPWKYFKHVYSVRSDSPSLCCSELSVLN